jgi:hypothetical protein
MNRVSDWFHQVRLHDSFGLPLPTLSSVPNRSNFVKFPHSVHALKNTALEQHMLHDFILLGYPPIPFSKSCDLLVVKAQLNAITSTRTSSWTSLVLSSILEAALVGDQS